MQLYKQMSFIGRKNFKLSTRFYGPYKILKIIGKVAYQLKLPSSFKLHIVFHVFKLKTRIGEECEVLKDFPDLNKKEKFVLT